MQIVKSSFSRSLVTINNLGRSDFHSWFFPPGAGFLELAKWWQIQENRPAPHEGLDFCLFLDNSKEIIPFEAPNLVPAMYPGQIANIFDDILGKTILVSHDIHDYLGRSLSSIYAHLSPRPEIFRGKKVQEGEILAEIAPVKNKKIPSHLHLSTIWIFKERKLEEISWRQINNGTAGELCNPKPFMDVF